MDRTATTIVTTMRAMPTAEAPRARPFRQPVIGVLGGSSDKATAEYYRLLNAEANARLGGWDNAEIVIASANFGNVEAFVRADDWAGARAYMDGQIDRLEGARVDLILCVSNTLHRVVAPLMEGRATPFLHIADPTGEAIRAAGVTRVGLLGTEPTMRPDGIAVRYRERFGIEAFAPEPDDARAVDRIIFDELCRGDIRRESKAEYLKIVGRLRERGAQGVILGCTEIFLLIDQADLPDYPVFNTTALHARAAIDFPARTRA